MRKPLAALLAALACVAGAQAARPPEPLEVSPQILEAQRRVWLNNRPQNYDLRVERTCFCAPRLVALNFQIRDFGSRLARQTPGLERGEVQGWVSVDKLYGTMRSLLAAGGAVRAVFDGRGVPTQITLDPLPRATDDEQYLSLTVVGR